MKILYLITSWDFGGAERQVLDLASVAQNNHINDVLIVSMIQPNSEFLHLSDRCGLSIISLDMLKGKASIKDLVMYLSVNKRFSPDIVHSHMVHANFLSRIGKLFGAKGKIVCTAHSICEGGKLIDLGYKMTDFLSSFNSNVSVSATNRYLDCNLFSKGKTEFIPNGISTDVIKSHWQNSTGQRESLVNLFDLDPNRFIFLAVGRFAEAKDYPNLINAVRLINKPLYVLIAGKGKLEREIMNLIENFNLGDSVKLIGLRTDIPTVLAGVDGYVMSSEWEGLPISILEAANVGVPSVVTDVGGCAEIVKNKINGYVVPPKSPQLLSNAMLNIMELNNHELTEMSFNANKIINDNYSMDMVMNKWLSIYNRVL